MLKKETGNDKGDIMKDKKKKKQKQKWRKKHEKNQDYLYPWTING